MENLRKKSELSSFIRFILHTRDVLTCYFTSKNFNLHLFSTPCFLKSTVWIAALQYFILQNSMMVLLRRNRVPPFRTFHSACEIVGFVFRYSKVFICDFQWFLSETAGCWWVLFNIENNKKELNHFRLLAISRCSYYSARQRNWFTKRRKIASYSKRQKVISRLPRGNFSTFWKQQTLKKLYAWSQVVQRSLLKLFAWISFHGVSLLGKVFKIHFSFSPLLQNCRNSDLKFQAPDSRKIATFRFWKDANEN